MINNKDPFLRTKKIVDTDMKSLENNCRQWKTLESYGKPRVEETKAYEVTILEGIGGMEQQVAELEARVEETQSAEEMDARKKFIAEVKVKLRGWQNAVGMVQAKRRAEEISEGGPMLIASASNQKSGLGDAPVTFPEEEIHQQQMEDIRRKEDDSLIRIDTKVRRLKQISQDINAEVLDQIEIAERLEEEAEETGIRLRVENKYIDKLLEHTRERKSWVAIILLGLLFVILFVVAFSVN